MKDKFAKIKKVYDEFHRQMLKQGRFMQKDTGIGYWGITPLTEIFELFQATELQKHKKFLDLGSGDGRAVIVADLFTNAEGIEYDEELVKFATLLAKKSNSKATIKQGDYLKQQLKNYDYLFIHPDNPIVGRLEQKLVDEMHPKAKLVIYNFRHHPISLKKKKVYTIQGTYVTIYTK